MKKYILKEQIALKDIDIDSDEYSLEYYQNIESDVKIEGEIRKYGFPYPPVLVFDNDKYKITFGRKYIDIHRRVNKAVPYGLVVDNLKDRSEFFKFLIYLKHEMNGFNVIEKTIALKKMFDTEGKIDPDVLLLLEIPSNEKIIKNYLLLARSSDTIKTLILNDSINEHIAFEIFKFAQKDWDKIACFIAGICLGTKRRNKILEMIYDILHKKQRGIKEIIESTELRKILRLNIDPPQIGERVYTFIEKLRYPYIHQYKERFYKKLKEVGIEKGFHFTVPSDFEDWKFKITLSFTSVDDFNEKVGILKKIGSKKAFHELMDLRC